MGIQEMGQQINKVHHKLNSSPLLNWILGAGSLVFWSAATVVQVQTSEYLAMGASTRVAGVTWSVLSQPALLITGQAPIQYATAWIYAWVVELVTLVFGLALSAAVAKIASVNPTIARWFVFCGIVLILLNGWADYSSSPGNNPLTQLLIAVAVGGIVVVGLPLGIGLIEHGISEL